jgi:hypothetical protein
MLLRQEEELIHELVIENITMLANHMEKTVDMIKNKMTEDIVKLNSQMMSVRVSNKLAAE